MARFRARFGGPSWLIRRSCWGHLLMLFASPFSKRFWILLGAVWGAKLGLKISQKRGRVVENQHFLTFASELVSGAFWGPSWGRFGAKLAPKTVPRRVQDEVKIIAKFWSLSGTVLGRFLTPSWAPRPLQNRPKIRPRAFKIPPRISKTNQGPPTIPPDLPQTSLGSFQDRRQDAQLADVGTPGAFLETLSALGGPRKRSEPFLANTLWG